MKGTVSWALKVLLIGGWCCVSVAWEWQAAPCLSGKSIHRGGQAPWGVLDGSNLSHSSCTTIALFSPSSGPAAALMSSTLVQGRWTSILVRAEVARLVTAALLAASVEPLSHPLFINHLIRERKETAHLIQTTETTWCQQWSLMTLFLSLLEVEGYIHWREDADYL